MINTVLLAMITGMMIGKWVIEPLIDVYLDHRDRASFDMMWDKGEWHDWQEQR